jgi:hypothetical protein
MRRSLARAVLAAAVALAALVLPASAASAAPPVDSNFSFCNNTGEFTIACFSAHLHFNGRGSFTMSNIKLSDTLCDGRSADAYPYTQVGFTGHGWENGRGCGTTQYYNNYTYTNHTNFVHYVHIRLQSCSNAYINPCSDSAWSLKHYNPYW